MLTTTPIQNWSTNEDLNENMDGTKLEDDATYNKSEVGLLMWFVWFKNQKI